MAREADEILQRVAANVRALRRARAWTQEDLAEAANLDLRRIQRVERAEVDVGLIALAALARALEVPPGRLFRMAKFEPPVKGRPATVTTKNVGKG
jgi:transcriptional regulator with XRE-family HTH domain